MEESDWEYIDANHRVGAEQDEAAWNDPPTSWGNSVVVPYPRSYWDGRGPDSWIDKEVGDDWVGIYEAARRFDEASEHGWRGKDKAVEATIRYARIFWDRVVVFDSDTNAFWYLPKTTIDYYTDPKNNPDAWLAEYHNGDLRAAETAIIEGEISTYHRWGAGEVYVVVAQVRRVEHIVVTNPVTDEVVREYDRESWEVDEALGGCYIDGWGSKFREEMLDIAKENFGDEYTKKEDAGA